MLSAEVSIIDTLSDVMLSGNSLMISVLDDQHRNVCLFVYVFIP